MYKCNHCGCEFSEPDTWEEDRGECWGSRAYEKMCGCPMCSSGDFDEYNEDEEESEEENERL